MIKINIFFHLLWLRGLRRGVNGFLDGAASVGESAGAAGGGVNFCARFRFLLRPFLFGVEAAAMAAAGCDKPSSSESHMA